MSRWHNGYNSGTVEMRPPGAVALVKLLTEERRLVPFALVVDHELEHTMAVWHAERHRVLAGLAWHGRQRGAHMRVEHRELELHVLDARIRLPV